MVISGLRMKNLYAYLFIRENKSQLSRFYFRYLKYWINESVYIFTFKYLKSRTKQCRLQSWISHFQIVKYANAEFWCDQNPKNRHFYEILSDGTRSRKYANFEGTYFYLTALFYSQLEPKKASIRMPNFRNSRNEKGVF